MNIDINKKLNDENYKVTVGKYQGYNVKFDLSFVPKVNTGWDEFERFKYGEIKIGNEFESADEGTEERFKPKNQVVNGKFEKVITAGTTYDSKTIKMNSKFDTQENRIHEIFHTFFFNRDNDINSGIGRYFNTNAGKPNEEDINILINNPDLPEVEKELG